MTRRTGPLDKICVVDLTTFLSGPYATQILGDLGADVIKVEMPGKGDSTRVLPPHMVHGDSAYFHSTNRNKQSICLNLKSERGRGILLDLLDKADVLIENFRPGVLDRLSLSVETLRARNPRLVICQITGFGQEGPYKDRPAYDMIVQALSGGMSMTGPKEGHAVRAGVPLGDLAAGMYAVIGTLAALTERQVTGRGQVVDVAMLDAQISMLSYQAQYYLVSGDVPGRQGAGHDSIPTYRAFMCGDGQEVVVTANTEPMWVSLCRVLGLDDLPADPRFADNTLRLQNKHALWDMLERAFGTKASAQWLPLLVDAGIPSARVNTVDQALADPQVIARDMVTTAHAADGRQLPITGDPVKFPAHGERAFSMPPRLGEHTRTLLAQRLGLTDDEIANLVTRGVVACDAGVKNKSGSKT